LLLSICSDVRAAARQAPGNAHESFSGNSMSAYRILGPGAERWRLACAATALNSLSVRSCMPDTVCPGLGFGGAEATL